MPRSRNIKPSLFKNELLGEADPMLTILFAGLWCLADRDGKLEDRPKRIKAEIFPYRECRDFNGYLTELERLGFIDRYEAEGQAIIRVLNFAKHQSPHKTEKASDLPDKPENTGLEGITEEAPLNNEPLTEEAALIPDSLIPDSCKGHFASFWSMYPKKVKKKPAQSAFQRLSQKDIDALLAHLPERIQDPQFKKYTPHPTTFINQRLWEDEEGRRKNPKVCARSPIKTC